MAVGCVETRVAAEMALVQQRAIVRGLINQAQFSHVWGVKL